MLFNLAIAYGLATLIADLFYAQHSSRMNWLLSITIIGFSGKAIALVISDVLANRTVEATKNGLRDKVLAKLSRLGSIGVSSDAQHQLLLTRGLDGLDAYFSKYLPQLVSAAISIPVLLLVFAVTDPISAGLIAVTLVLIPVFMILIGWATRAVQNRQWLAMQQLNSHFLELLRGMLTLKVFGRENRQGAQIEKVSEKYRLATMKVLRVSFLSGFALELFSSLSVAIVAVSIGLRLLDGQMLLGLALFVLILAPELFSPIRAVGANFHAASEGIQAAEDIFQILDFVEEGFNSSEDIELNHGVIQIKGESGSGKSTLIEELVGVREGARFSRLGTSTERMSKCAWMPQRSVLLPTENVHDQIVFGRSVDNKILEKSVKIAVLDDVDLNAPISADGRGFSGGQIQRIALARTLYRFFHANCEILVLDEPTSSIDDKRVQQFSENLKKAMPGSGRLVIASHDPRFTFEATQVVKARV